MRWITTTGGAITAATREAAQALARDYGMGEIVRAEAPAQPARGPITYVLWDDLTQSEIACGDAQTVAAAWVESHGGHPVLMVQTARGMRRPTNAERRAVIALAQEASE